MVDAEAALWEELPVRTEDSYSRTYMQWRGDPPVLVDRHPNPAAHRIIADSVLRELIEPQDARSLDLRH